MIPDTEEKYMAINEEMSRVAPVLSSAYARYPLHNEQWLKPFETTSDGRPAFIPTCNFPQSLIDLNTDIPDYVWGYGSLGKGYYHLLTKESYKNLLDYMNMADLGIPHYLVSVLPGCRKRHQEFQAVKNIIEIRCSLKKPNESFLCKRIEDIKEKSVLDKKNTCHSCSKGCDLAQ